MPPPTPPAAAAGSGSLPGSGSPPAAGTGSPASPASAGSAAGSGSPPPAAGLKYLWPKDANFSSILKQLNLSVKGLLATGELRGADGMRLTSEEISQYNFSVQSLLLGRQDVSGSQQWLGNLPSEHQVACKQAYDIGNIEFNDELTNHGKNVQFDEMRAQQAVVLESIASTLDVWSKQIAALDTDKERRLNEAAQELSNTAAAPGKAQDLTYEEHMAHFDSTIAASESLLQKAKQELSTVEQAAESTKQNVAAASAEVEKSQVAAEAEGTSASGSDSSSPQKEALTKANEALTKAEAEHQKPSKMVKEAETKVTGLQAYLEKYNDVKAQLAAEKERIDSDYETGKEAAKQCSIYSYKNGLMQMLDELKTLEKEHFNRPLPRQSFRERWWDQTSLTKMIFETFDEPTSGGQWTCSALKDMTTGHIDYNKLTLDKAQKVFTYHGRDSEGKSNEFKFKVEAIGRDKFYVNLIGAPDKKWKKEEVEVTLQLLMDQQQRHAKLDAKGKPVMRDDNPIFKKMISVPSEPLTEEEIEAWAHGFIAMGLMVEPAHGQPRYIAMTLYNSHSPTEKVIEKAKKLLSSSTQQTLAGATLAPPPPKRDGSDGLSDTNSALSSDDHQSADGDPRASAADSRPPLSRSASLDSLRPRPPFAPPRRQRQRPSGNGLAAPLGDPAASSGDSAASRMKALCSRQDAQKLAQPLFQRAAALKEMSAAASTQAQDRSAAAHKRNLAEALRRETASGQRHPSAAARQRREDTEMGGLNSSVVPLPVPTGTPKPRGPRR